MPVRLRIAVAALVALALVPLLAPGGAAGGRKSRLTLTALELSTVKAINDLRVSHGVAPLAVSPALFGSALLHCQEMVGGGYFSHSAPDGSSFAARIAAFYPQGRSTFYSVGENLLRTLRPPSSDEMVASWMQSREHRANLLNPIWRQLAVAVLSVSSAPGAYDDGRVTVVTVDFGARR